MKNRLWDRVLIFLYVLLTAALAALFVLRAFDIDLVESLFAGLSAAAPGIVWKLIVVGLGAIVVLLGLYVVVAVTPARGKKTNFISISSDEGGQVKIALPAMREMAEKAIDGIVGSENMAIDVNGEGDSITVDISMDMAMGTHVPSVTGNIQHSVKTYIESNCGVHVRDVSVVINSMLPAAEGSEQTPVQTFEAPRQQTDWQMPDYSEFTAKTADEEPPAEEAPAEEEEITEEQPETQAEDAEKTEE